jgi:glutamine synthetase
LREPTTFGHRGYLEDRRPNSLGDPYRIAGRIVQTIEEVPTEAADSALREPERAVA